MRIAIVTHPLMENYGGLLQNYALQQVLHKIVSDAEVLTFDQVDSVSPFLLRIGSQIKSSLKKLIGKNSKPGEETEFNNFRKTFIAATAKAKSDRDMRRLDRRFHPDVIIVGSDQVWRPKMVRSIEANFLAFSRCRNKISYAASFGTSEWEFTREQMAKCKKLISTFSAISVREADGVNLCSSYLGRSAKHVLDPTMLLNVEDYAALENPVSGFIDSPFVFTYMLDTNATKRNFVKQTLQRLQLSEFNAARNAHGGMPGNRPSPGEWLYGISKACLVVCDSFHGVAFSVIYKRDFYVLPNPERGNSRIESILSLLGLESRMVSDFPEFLEPINWDAVYMRLDKLRDISLNFLKEAICKA